MNWIVSFLSPTLISSIITGVISISISFWLASKKIQKQSLANIAENTQRTQDQLHADYYSSCKKILYEKKIYTLDIVWNFFIEYPKTIPSQYSICYRVLSKKQLIECTKNKEIISDVRRAIKDYDSLNNLVLKQSIMCDKIQKLRYLISKDLYTICEVYYIILGRFTVLMTGDLILTQDPIFVWQEDIQIQDNLKKVLTKEEFTYVYANDTLGGLGVAEKLIKEKALQKIMHEISGEEEAKIVLNHFKNQNHDDYYITLANRMYDIIVKSQEKC